MPKYCYLLSYLIPLVSLISIVSTGIYTYFAPFIIFFILPLMELSIKTVKYNFSENEEKRALNSKFYDYLVYSMVPVQFFLIFVFSYIIMSKSLSHIELFGIIFSMGISCGVIGINVGHELGHRVKKSEQLMAKLLLLTSLYTHFFIEHNKGHHRFVATEKDPASANKGDIVYLFWFKSIFGSFKSALRFESLRVNKSKELSWFDNQILRWKVFECLFILFILFVFGLKASICFVLAAIIGALLLESVNYIEHYGLRRKKVSETRYERVTPMHSWNSDHPIGRLVLFDLSRHSDHHANPNRKYQILRSFQNGPQFPTGYPGMLLLSFIPPLWFKVMDKKVNQWEQLNLS